MLIYSSSKQKKNLLTLYQEKLKLADYLELVKLENISHAILDSIEVSIPACHAGDPGSIPGRGDQFFAFLFAELICQTQILPGTKYGFR